MLFLAQLGNIQNMIDVPDPTPLPEPGPLQRHLLESPWLIVAALLGVAVVTLFWRHGRGETRRGVLHAGIAAAVALVVWMVATLVVTARENLRETTRGLIGAVAAADIGAVRSRLTDDCVYIGYPAPEGGMRIDPLLTAVSTYFGTASQFAVADWKMVRFQAVAEGGSARVQVKVWVRSAAGIPNNSWWRLDYQKEPDGRWRASGIMPLEIQDFNVRGLR
ncbi:MAG TPA: hypothetical protein VD971_13840 [Phycisphaerales bacterium]|nr:hypothetical protein [Phycisphaerales bacterium]